MNFNYKFLTSHFTHLNSLTMQNVSIMKLDDVSNLRVISDHDATGEVRIMERFTEPLRVLHVVLSWENTDHSMSQSEAATRSSWPIKITVSFPTTTK